jgi:hypothetical protein
MASWGGVRAVRAVPDVQRSREKTATVSKWWVFGKRSKRARL